MQSHRKDIVILDDNPFFVRMAERALLAAGYSVRTACDRASLEVALALRTPDLVITDVHMPDVAGTDLAVELRRRIRVPIVLLSSIDEIELGKLAKEAGAAGAVSKQAGIAGLLAVTRETLDAYAREPSHRHHALSHGG